LKFASCRSCGIPLLDRGRVKQNVGNGRIREYFTSDLDPLGSEFELAHEDARDIAAGARKACYISLRQRIEVDRQEGDRSSFGRHESGP
jgi:hypothetical protein